MEAGEIEPHSHEDDRPSLRPLFDDSDDETVVGECESVEKFLDPEAELESFRQRWRAEICNNESTTRESSVKRGYEILASSSKHEVATFERARDRFLQGVECEKQGDMFEAVKHYHQAVRLVPDIEQQLYAKKQGVSHSNSGHALMSLTADDDEIELFKKQQLFEKSVHTEPVDLVELARQYSNGPYCQPVAQQHGAPKHIGNLNQDIWLNILRWLIGRHTVDVHQLESVSRVSRGLYALTRKPVIWRLIAQVLWRQLDMVIAMTQRLGSFDYRKMVITQPHVWHDGLYIGKCTYVRHGEASFQDQFYKPWFLITYYRYFRAWANGLCVMVVSTSAPLDIVPMIKTYDPAGLSQRLNTEATLFYGKYDYINNDGLIKCELQKSDRKERIEERRRIAAIRSQAIRSNRSIPYNIDTLPIYTAILQLRIEAPRRKLHGRQHSTVLSWQSYITRAHYIGSNTTVDAVIDHKDHSAFPSLIFSRVKSYTQSCDTKPV